MAISKVSQGVYVITPSKVDTFGSKYTQLFTKRREEQWQMAQKQALMEMELGADAYKEEMRLYREKQQLLLQQKAKLDQALIDVQEGRIKDINDARLKAFDLQQEVNAQAAEKMGLSLPSTTTTTRTGTADTKGTLPSTVSSSAGDQIAAVEGTFGNQTLDQKAATIATSTRSGGMIGRATESEGDRYAAVGTMGLRLAASEKARLLREGQSESDASKNSNKLVYEALKKTDPVAAEEFKTYASGIDTTTAGTTGTGVTTKTERTGGGQTTVTKRPGLEATAPSEPLRIMYGQAGFMVDEKGEVVKDAEGRPIPNTAGIEAGIRARQEELDKQMTGMARPSFTGFDYITRARDITAGRFGPTSPSPAYGQRNALQSLLGADEGMRAAVLEQYRKSLPKAAPVAPGAPAPSVPATTPGGPVTASTTPAELESRWAKVGVVRPNTGDAAADEAAYQAAKDAWAKSQAPSPTAPVTIPDTEEFYSPFTMAPGQSAESILREAVDVGAQAGTPGLLPGAKSALEQLADTKFKEAQRRFDEEARIGGEIAVSERPFEYPFEQRGGETVPFTRKTRIVRDERGMLTEITPSAADVRAMEEYAAGQRDIQGRQAPPMGTYPTATEPSAVAPVPLETAPPVTPPSAPASVPEAGPVAPADIRPEAAALMSPAEIQEYREMLLARRGPSAIEVARNTTFLPPAQLPAPVRPQMTPPVGIAESMGAIRVPSGVKPPTTLPSIGRYTPGALPPAPRAEAPSAADVAPRAPAELPAGYLQRKPARPEDTTEFLTMMREGKSPAVQRAEDAAAAGKTVADIKAVGAEAAFGGGKKGADPKLDYLFKRVEAATALSKRDDKLRRLTASGPGKTAQELYARNARDGIPFTVTYAKITEIFKDDREGMMRAHEVALALDLKADNKEPQ